MNLWQWFDPDIEEAVGLCAGRWSLRFDLYRPGLVEQHQQFMPWRSPCVVGCKESSLPAQLTLTEVEGRS